MQWSSTYMLMSGILLVSIVQMLYELSMSFILPQCAETRDRRDCIISSLHTKPQLHLSIFTSPGSYPIGLNLVHSEKAFNYSETHQMQVLLPIHEDIHRTGELFFHVLLSSERVVKYPGTYYELIQEPFSHYSNVEMTHYEVPEVALLDSLNNEEKFNKSMEDLSKPVSYLKTQVTLNMVTDDIKLPMFNVPREIAHMISVTNKGIFLPILLYNFPETFHKDSVKLSSQIEAINVTIHYKPISIEKLRLILNLENNLESNSFSFSDRSGDEIRGILIDTNPFLLGGAGFILVMHPLFLVLTLKFNAAFWRSRENWSMNAQTILWPVFSRAVIVLYFFGEQCLNLVVAYNFGRLIIEFWKLIKWLSAELIIDQSWLPRIRFRKNESGSGEEKKTEFTTKIMKYLSRLLYPMIVGGAMYSLLYQPQKSWYFWGINSLVNGVFAFNFLSILPEISDTYELKSVPYLPRLAMIYKALDTLNDVWAFIIPMPIAYRIACISNDAIFLVNLYQTCIYPVENSDKDNAVTAADDAPASPEMHNKKED